MKKTTGIILAIAMILSLSLTAFAAEGDVTVDGHIGTSGDPTTGPDGTYDITYTTAVHWWVTQAAPTTVVDGNPSGPATVVNTIQNNNTATEIEVSLESFATIAGDATDLILQGYLTLFLTGDLAEDGVGLQDLSAGYATPTAYTAILEGGATEAWTYGFGGTYGGSTLTTSYAPQYTMTLGFAFAQTPDGGK